MPQERSHDRVVVAHVAGSAMEAVVIRGLLESAGILSPGNSSHDPYPLDLAPEGMHGPEICVLESQADEARRIIADFLQESSSEESPDVDPEAAE